MNFNEENIIDLIDYKHLFINAEGKTTVTIVVQDKYGTERSTSFTVEIVKLNLKALKDNIINSTSSNYIFGYILTGGSGSALSSRVVEYNFYTEKDLTTSVLT